MKYLIVKILLIFSIVIFTFNMDDASAQRSRGRAVVPTKNMAKKTFFGGMKKSEINKFFKKSLLFSPLEIALIQKALKGRPPSVNKLRIEKQNIPERRVIKISGVLYRGKNDWIVWMNGTKVTPGHLLPEILEIEVKNSSYVRLKWYDIGLNAVISITMRPHQIYDIGTGILLPG